MLTYLPGGTFSPGTAVILSRLITRKDLNGFHTYAQNRQSRHWVLGKCMHTPDRQAESCEKDAKRDMGFIAHTHRDFMNARMQKRRESSHCHASSYLTGRRGFVSRFDEGTGRYIVEVQGEKTSIACKLTQMQPETSTMQVETGWACRPQSTRLDK